MVIRDVLEHTVHGENARFNRNFKYKWIINRRIKPKEGGSSHVYTCTAPKNFYDENSDCKGNKFVAKELFQGYRELYEPELRAYDLALGHCKYLLPVYDYGFDYDAFGTVAPPTIIKEKAQGIKIDTSFTKTSTQEKLTILKQSIEYLQYLQKVGVIDRDFKIDGIFWNKAKREIEVVELGLAVFAQNKEEARQIANVNYFSPQRKSDSTNLIAANIAYLFEGNELSLAKFAAQLKLGRNIKSNLMPAAIQTLLTDLINGKYSDLEVLGSEIDKVSIPQQESERIDNNILNWRIDQSMELTAEEKASDRERQLRLFDDWKALKMGIREGDFGQREALEELWRIRKESYGYFDSAIGNFGWHDLNFFTDIISEMQFRWPDLKYGEEQWSKLFNVKMKEWSNYYYEIGFDKAKAKTGLDESIMFEMFRAMFSMPELTKDKQFLNIRQIALLMDDLFELHREALLR